MTLAELRHWHGANLQGTHLTVCPECNIPWPCLVELLIREHETHVAWSNTARSRLLAPRRAAWEAYCEAQDAVERAAQGVPA